MNDPKSQLLILISSRLLTYPDDTFIEQTEDILNAIEQIELSADLKDTLFTCVNSLTQVDIWELREVYVETFDMKESTGLYLTAHEMGDSRKRGAAFIKLQKLVNEAGFERVEGELADYIPMLYELLAVVPDSWKIRQLEKRLAFATQRIGDHLNSDNVYKPIFSILMTHVFEALSSKEIEDIENNREIADMEDEMPFPMMYK